MKHPFKINGKEVTKPIIQGGMGIGISLSGLATASIKAGIVGTISAAQAGFELPNFGKDNVAANFEKIKSEIQKIRDKAPKGILGINLMHATRRYEEYVEFIKNLDVDFIVSGAGLPIDLPRFLKGSKVKPAVIVSSARAAKLIVKKWKRSFDVTPEFLVVEGPLAGGHLGFTKEDFEAGKVKSLEEICVEVIDTLKPLEEEYGVKIPVIAAGGVVTGEDIARFEDLGCAGVQMATKFIATHECDASDAYKQKIIDAKKEDVVQVPSPVGLPGRAIRNKFSDYVQNHKIKVSKCNKCIKGCPVVGIPYCITEKLSDAVKGDVENGLVFSGAKAYMVNKMQSVEELVDELMTEYKRVRLGEVSL